MASSKPSDKEKDFVASAPPWVIIPYSEYEKVVNMAQEVAEIKAQYARLQEQYTAIRGMFSECLTAIGEIREYVSD